MVKTQIQLPDHLYREAKRIAEQYEMSLAEVVRRGLERLVPCYPQRTGRAGEWRLPRLDLGLARDPFAEAEWRADLHLRDSEVAEPAPAESRRSRRGRAR